MDDLGGAPRKRASIKRPEGAAAAQKQARPTTDWADEDQEEEYINDLIAKEGPFFADDMGILPPESFMKLRKVISMGAFMKFKPRKEALMKDRLGFYKKKMMQQYGQCIQVAA